MASRALHAGVRNVVARLVGPASAAVAVVAGVLVASSAALAGPLRLPSSATTVLQSSAQAASALVGTTTTQSGAVPLAGVRVTVVSEQTGREVVVESDATGRYTVEGLEAGSYRARAALAGFADVVREHVRVGVDERVRLDLDLPVASLEETVDVTAGAGDAPDTAAARDSVAGELIDVAPLSGDDFRALLPIVPGVIRGPDGRINLKGGRPTQTGLQVSDAYAGDPSTGDFGFDLPVDAVESVEVQPNPFAAEFGRFSSGVARIETRSGGDRWRATLNNPLPMPCLVICDGRTLGVRRWGPRAIVGGPLVEDRLFLSQSAHFRTVRERVPGLPRGDDDFWLRSFDALTRLDARLGGGHLVTGTLAVFPRNVHFLHLSALNPEEATPNFRQRGYNVLLEDTATFGDRAVLESTFNVKRYDADVFGQGDEELTLTPAGTRGNFFNEQQRRTRTLQWIESLSLYRDGRGGEHLVKAGVDLLHTTYRGESRSRPVNVVRADGSRAQRVTFGGTSLQDVDATDVGIFVQDRWRPSDRLLFELGARVDRDGVTRRTNLAPRAGFALGVLDDGRGILRGGAGRFFERTPLVVGAFESFERRMETSFAADGATPIAPPLRFRHRSAPGLRVPFGTVWNLEYDHKLTTRWLVKVNHLRRRGRDELLVHPVRRGSTAELRLDNRGASTYRETEVTVRYAGEAERELTLTYVNSRSEGDLNSYDRFFGNFRTPIIRPNERSLRSIDVPHRLVVLAVWPILDVWTISPLLEIRSGFPYSLVNENQEFVGRQHTGGRFPTFSSLDLAITRAVTIKNRRVRIGFRSFHILNRFQPRTVQNNVDAPGFGTFHDSILRKIGLMFEIQP